VLFFVVYVRLNYLVGVISMLLSLKNVCKIRSAEIKIEGITVITGNNDTGKSTIGKSLLLFFESFYNTQDNMNDDQCSDIDDVLESILAYGETYGLATTILEQKEEFATDKISLAEFIREKLHEDLDEDDEDDVETFEETDFVEKAEKIIKILKLQQKDYLHGFVNRGISQLFHGSINNIYSSSKTSELILTIKKTPIVILVENEKVSDISKAFSFSAEAVYIDDPFVLDNPLHFSGRFGLNTIKMNLLKQVYNVNQISVTSELIIGKELDEVLNKMNVACSGALIHRGRNVFYRDENSNKELPIGNISTGLKSFLILKTLLLNGSLKENGTLILDEPEVHLHPEWQLIYAEIIVLLQKSFNLHILLATHSPYFVQAIETYSQVHNIQDKCHYYLSHTEKDRFEFQDVTNDLEPLYKKFANPYQTLEDLECDNAEN